MASHNGVEFTVSSLCADSACVEVAIGNDYVDMRSPTINEKGQLTYTAAEWQAFLGGAALGDFDITRKGE